MTRSDLIDLAVRNVRQRYTDEDSLFLSCAPDYCDWCREIIRRDVAQAWPRLLSSHPITDTNPGGGGKG
jgi:hypothetical protein